MKIIDAATLLKTPPKLIKYLVEGLLPSGGNSDVFGGPGEGKSTLLLSLMTAVASGKGSWHGLKCVGGAVVSLGGERSSEDCFQRDLHRAGKYNIAEGDLTHLNADSGSHAIWEWNKKLGDWVMTGWGKELTEYLYCAPPVLIVMDTIMSVARGNDQIDNTQQYRLGEVIDHWTKKLNTTSITVSHTNQVSAKDDLSWRLNYLSRAGGNGYPGQLRWLAGLSRLRPTDAITDVAGLKERAATERLICFGTSKHNEMPQPVWTHDAPAIFKMNADGSLILVKDGREVWNRLKTNTKKEVGRKNGAV